MPGMMLGAVCSFSHLILMTHLQTRCYYPHLTEEAEASLPQWATYTPVFCFVFVGLVLVFLWYRVDIDHSFSKIIKSLKARTSSVLFPLDLQHTAPC